MSRVGRAPITVPNGVTVTIDGNNVDVKGKLGQLDFSVPNGINVNQEDEKLVLQRRDDSKPQKALHGLSRALIANMVTGVTNGFQKNLEIVGVGYRAEQKGKALQLAIGFSHRVIFIPPEGIEIKVTGPTGISVKGIDRQLVGEVAAKIRAIRPPEPYKGKGIKYAGEHIRRKAGKAAAK